MPAIKSNAVKDLLTFMMLALLVVGLGVGTRSVQEYMAGDWRAVANCRGTYWQCSSEVGGAGIGTAGDVKFIAGAKSCNQIKAYESSIRRASLDCNFSRSVLRHSCREIRTNCILPNSPSYY